MDSNEPQNITYYSKTEDIYFYVLGTEENLIDSNGNVTNKEVLKGDRPMPDGIYDPHFGTTDHMWNCATCGCKKTVCPGHFGSIDLRYPIKSPMFRDELLKWLKVICYYCGNLLTTIKKKVKTIKRLGELVKGIRMVKACDHCGRAHMQVVKDKKKPTVFYRIQEEGKNIIKKEEFFNHEIDNLLQKIRDQTVIYLGKPLRSHPRNFILRSVRVPPNTIRPDIRRIGGARSSNSDTTSLLKNIVEINLALPEEIPPSHMIESDLKDMYFNLDMTCYAMIKGGGGGDIKLLTNTNKPPVAIAEHFPQKSGRVRRNLMGKRVCNMTRSVLTGDPDLAINEVGVPLIHAKVLEIPETVTKENIDRLNIYYSNKTDNYPGCKRVIKKSNNRAYRVDKLHVNNYLLQFGDIVLRDMIDGDYLSFNRQPSLLFSSIAGMRVVVLSGGDTLRINPAICNYFNADFDGDQMNGIIPTDIQSRNECMTVSKVSRWLISPQHTAPSIGAFQDALIGITELSKDGLKFNKWKAMCLFNKIMNSDRIDFNFTKKTYTNRELISKLLPKINIIGKTPTIYKSSYASLLKYNPKDIEVNIIRGELQSGIIDKATSGQDVMGSIFHIIANEYGHDITLETIFNMQQIVHQFLLYHGFTVGIKDITVSSSTTKEIKRRISSMILESRKITHRLNSGKLFAPIGMKLSEFNEIEQLNALSAGDEFVNPILADIDIETNMLFRLIASGSKGKPPNFISINGAICSATINGARPLMHAGWGRTSPYFLRYETEPSANGFISTCFKEGVCNDVYPFMAGEARHGLISNALKTSVTGYQNRISIKNLETISVDNLRKSTKGLNVIQPLYAESGMNSSKTEKVKFITVMSSDKDFEAQFHTKIESVHKNFQNAEVKKKLDQEFLLIKEDREKFRSIFMQLEDHNPLEYVLSDSKQVPVNVGRIIDDTVFNYSTTIEELESKKLFLDPLYTIQQVNELCDTIGYSHINEIQKKNKKPIPPHIESSCLLLKILFRSYLSTSYLLKKKVVNCLLDIIIQRINITFKKALIDYGTNVGIIAAQCVSAPLTQYVLDSRHRVGGQGGTRTNAIIRLQEILGAKPTDSMKNTNMLIMVKKEFYYDKLKVQEIANHIEMIKFNKFISDTRVFFEEYGKPTHPTFVKEGDVIASIAKHNYGQQVPSDLTNWCIRFGIDKEELILKSMKMETVVLAIRMTCPSVFVIYSPENSDNLFIRCYLRNGYFKPTNTFYETCVLPTLDSIKEVIVRGIKDIINTRIIDVIKHEKNPDGSIEMKKIYAIGTTGTNLSEILLNPYIDNYKTQSDSIIEIEQIFGVVAARNKIMNEMIKTLDGLTRIHCSVFADEMTYGGGVTSIQKTGLTKREAANISLRMSFQTPVQIMQEASINGLCDKISGVSGPLIVGTNPNIGTTYNTMIVNEEFVKKYYSNLNSKLEEL